MIWGHVLEAVTGLVYVVWIVAMHHTNSPTSVMSRYVLPAILAIAYCGILAVSYIGPEDPHAWLYLVIRAVAAVFLYLMLLLVWTLRGGATQITSASRSLGPIDLVRRFMLGSEVHVLQLASVGSERGDELLAAQQRRSA